MKITFNILGCCVLRDIFSMHDDDGGYQINQFVNEFTPLFSLDEKKVNIDFDKCNLIDSTKICSNFLKRCLLLEVSRNVFSYIERKKSDYLLLDSALLRQNYFLLENGQYVYGAYRNFYNFMNQFGIIPPIKNEYPMDFLGYDEIERRIRKYCYKIKQIYNVNKIILIEVQNKFIVYDKIRRSIFCFDHDKIELYKKQNEIINFGFKIMMDELKGCHIIRMPNNVICDKNHKLKMAPLHFTKGAYDYYLKSIKIILNQYPLEKEEMLLEKIYKHYEMRYSYVYFKILCSKMIKLQFENKSLKDLIKNYKM